METTPSRAEINVGVARNRSKHHVEVIRPKRQPAEGDTACCRAKACAAFTRVTPEPLRAGLKNGWDIILIVMLMLMLIPRFPKE
jgi:hypothetical protein